jgi:hypothetical protein
MGCPVVHFEVGTTNIEKALKLYSELGGWEIAKFGEMDYYGVETKSGGAGIGGGIFLAPDASMVQVTVYAEVDDVQKYLDRCVELGGKVVMPSTPIEGVGEVGMFTDPDGNAFGLYKPLPQG